MAPKNNNLVTGYLFLYNTLLTVGWAYVFFLSVQNYSDLGGLWRKVEFPLKIFQTAAILEIVHAILGFVSSNVVLTFFQVFSRVFVLWGILELSPPSQTCFGVPLLLFAWGVTEIIRYGYYALNLVGLASIIQWFRYTLFIVLYPIGITGELACIYFALSYVKQNGILTAKMPNALNFTFDYQYFLVGTMLSYIPIFPQLYFHMFAQRKKILGKGPTVHGKVK